MTLLIDAFHHEYRLGHRPMESSCLLTHRPAALLFV
ncbi:hypothetical protein PsAD14_03896 [Pseudovibrio sp. Ad14]|nr:hypothetical protein PsW74_01001 [Pseudovibrio sp. W74]KZL07510.1 hypothetical protein PsAD14_03896 [Pseudovibrio sp. Ad14]